MGWLSKKKPEFKPYLLDEKYRIVKAFELKGKSYLMFDDPMAAPTGRSLCAITIYDEFDQRCNREYLKLHTRAMTKLLSDPKKINIEAIAILNRNLSERLDMAMFPDHVYKLASVIFFDENESPYNYDYKYNQQKIEEWKASEGTLDFFLKTPLRDLIPSLKLPEDNAEMFFQVASQMDQLYLNDLQEILSSQG